MGKKWDRLDWTDGGGMMSVGMGGREIPWPSYSGTGAAGTANATCAACGGRMRGGNKCSCDKPDWRVKGQPLNLSANAERMRKQQDSHRIWLTEVYRVLRPGAVIKAFSGTRTFHRMAAAMAEAGFVNLHVISWCYGSGFPKSLNIGKSLDKQAGRVNTSTVTLKKELRALFDASGKSRTTIDKECGFRACNYLSYPEPGKQHDPWFNVLPSQAKWRVMKQVLGVVGDGVEAELDKFFYEAEREVIGFKKVVPGVAFSSDGPSEMPVTLPATEASCQWDGWGTALKPSWEPVCVGRKPE
jgi:hypothetical protein